MNLRHRMAVMNSIAESPSDDGFDQDFFNFYNLMYQNFRTYIDLEELHFELEERKSTCNSVPELNVVDELLLIKASLE